MPKRTGPSVWTSLHGEPNIWTLAYLCLNSSKKSDTAKGNHWLSQTCLTAVFSACVCQSLSCVWLFATVWTIAARLHLFMGSPGKNTAKGCHSLLHGIFLAQGLNLGLLHCRWALYHLSHQGSLPSVSAPPPPPEPNLVFLTITHWNIFGTWCRKSVCTLHRV